MIKAYQCATMASVFGKYDEEGSLCKQFWSYQLLSLIRIWIWVAQHLMKLLALA